MQTKVSTKTQTKVSTKMQTKVSTKVHLPGCDKCATGVTKLQQLHLGNSVARLSQSCKNITACASVRNGGYITI